MDHRMSIWRSLRDWRHVCRCGEWWPCVRYRQQRHDGQRSPVAPALNPDMDQQR